MIIQIGLLAALLLCMGYALTQRRKSRLISHGISAVGVIGMFFVLYPEYSNELANVVGVGRGADLIFYCWIVISFLISVNLQFKILAIHENLVKMTQVLAILTAESPGIGPYGHQDPR